MLFSVSFELVPPVPWGQVMSCQWGSNNIRCCTWCTCTPSAYCPSAKALPMSVIYQFISAALKVRQGSFCLLWCYQRREHSVSTQVTFLSYDSLDEGKFPFLFDDCAHSVFSQLSLQWRVLSTHTVHEHTLSCLVWSCPRVTNSPEIHSQGQTLLWARFTI